MFSRTLNTAALALAASQLVSAQTHTKCNPMEKECGTDPAIGGDLEVSFVDGKNGLFVAQAGTSMTYDPELGATFTIAKQGQAPTLHSNKYIFGGKVEAEIQASDGAGIVTAFVLQSDNLDEIDWEWLGGDTTQVQSNYFGKGDDSTFDRGGFHDVSSPQTGLHTYTIEWDPSSHLTWSIDGTVVRELKYGEAKGGTRFPQTPMQIRLGTWCGGCPDQPEGTIEWSGGPTDFNQGPFHAYMKSIKITDYAGGKDNAAEYEWAPAPNDGSYKDISVITGNGNSDDDDETTTSSASPSTTSAPTSTKSEETSKTNESTKTEESTTGSPDATPTGDNDSDDNDNNDSDNEPTGTSTTGSGSGPTATPTGDDETDSGSDDATPTSDDAPAEQSSEIPQGAGVRAIVSPLAVAAGLFFALF